MNFCNHSWTLETWRSLDRRSAIRRELARLIALDIGRAKEKRQPGCPLHYHRRFTEGINPSRPKAVIDDVTLRNIDAHLQGNLFESAMKSVATTLVYDTRIDRVANMMRPCLESVMCGDCGNDSPRGTRRMACECGELGV
jgi:hypothetical protein